MSASFVPSQIADISGLASALAALSAADAALSSSKASLGTNQFTGSQTILSGQNVTFKNATDWPGVQIDGTGLVGKNTSNAQTWSINSGTGVISGVGSGLTGIPVAAVTDAVTTNTTQTITAAKTLSATLTAAAITMSGAVNLTLGSGGNIVAGGLVISQSNSDIRGNGANPVTLRGHSVGGGTIVQFSDGTNAATSGTVTCFRITPSINQTSGTAANTMLLINPTVTNTGSGAQNIILGQWNSVDKFSVSSVGRIVATNTIQLASIDTGTIAGTVAGQIVADSTSGKVKRWNGSAWASVEV